MKATILDRYKQKFQKSAELFEQAKIDIPAGSQQPEITRPFPVFVEKAQGAVQWDVEGNELIDYVTGYSALILGHSRQEVVDAVSRQMSQGTIMSTPTPHELRWAQVIKRLMPSVERVRFTASGATASLLAVRLARAYTGRSTVMKFPGHYHGWHGDIAIDNGSSIVAGIPKESLAHVIVAPPDLGALDRLLGQNKDVAAVIVDPLGPGIGVDLERMRTFLQGLRGITERHNIVMILDEAVSGFRLSRGGAQVRFNVTPDLTIMSKIVTGGLPGGAVGGRADLMGLVASEEEERRVVHKSSWNANPLSAVAGYTALEIIEREPINKLADAMADRLCQGLNQVCIQLKVAGYAHSIASEVYLTFEAPCDDAFKLAMLVNGVHTWHTWALHVSAAHREEHIDRTIEAFEQSVKMLHAERVL